MSESVTQFRHSVLQLSGKAQFKLIFQYAIQICQGTEDFIRAFKILQMYILDRADAVGWIYTICVLNALLNELQLSGKAHSKCPQLVTRVEFITHSKSLYKHKIS
jgi:hypothetical protein